MRPPAPGPRWRRLRSDGGRSTNPSSGPRGARPDAVACPPTQPEDPMTARRLTQTEEIRLARSIERGDRSAKETMIESNLGLVRAIARTFRSTSLSFDDLVQDGTVGLVQAVERFDH